MNDKIVRKCRTCLVDLELNSENFRSYRSSHSGNILFRNDCWKCSRRLGTERARSESYKRNARINHLRKYYNISLEEYDKMFELQNGLCFICGSPSGKKLLSVDHDHKTGKIRKLLCKNCNTGLGCFREDVDLFLKAIRYLQDHSSYGNVA